jgi:hypothetical protein
MSTIPKARSNFLGVKRTSAERFLLDWANMNLERGGVLSDFQKRYSTVLGKLDPDTLILLQGQLRMAWDSPDQRSRDWYLTQLRTYFYQYHARAEFAARPVPQIPGIMRYRLAPAYQLLPPPPLTEFEASLFYLQTEVKDLVKHCGGGPDCPAPYFIATKRWQKYCSEACSGPALREQKAEWWRNHRAKNGGEL